MKVTRESTSDLEKVSSAVEMLVQAPIHSANLEHLELCVVEPVK